MNKKYMVRKLDDSEEDADFISGFMYLEASAGGLTWWSSSPDDAILFASMEAAVAVSKILDAVAIEAKP